MPISTRLIGLARLLLLLCLLIALVHPVYSQKHCQGLLPKFCYMHPGKRNSHPTKAIDTEQTEGEIQHGNIPLSNSDSSSLSQMEAIIALLLGPVDAEERYSDGVEEDADSLTRPQKVRILTRLLKSRQNSF